MRTHALLSLAPCLMACSFACLFVGTQKQREGYEALVDELAGELASAGFEVDTERLSVSVRSREKSLGMATASMDAIFRPSHFEGMQVVFRGLRTDLGETVDDVRTNIARSLLGDFYAMYDFNGKTLVFFKEAGITSEDPSSHNQVIHELVHAWRDQKSDLASALGVGERTFEDVRVALCLSEGEAEAVTTALLRERSGKSLSDMDPGEYRIDGIGAEAARLPYLHGTRFTIRQYRAGGWPAVERCWEQRPPSTEQIIHPTKLGADVPSAVALPEWPGAELVHEDVMGEMGLLGVLLSPPVDRNEAYVAAAGWDGDRLRVIRKGDDRALLMRSVWDRPVDAEQFAALWKRLSGGSVTVRGRSVDWVWGESMALLREGKQVLGAQPFEAPVIEEDARTTKEVEDAFARLVPHVADGRWFVPEMRISAPAPDGWEVGAVNGIPLLRGSAVAGFSNNFNVTGIVVTDDLDTHAENYAAQLEGMSFGIEGPVTAREIGGLSARVVSYDTAGQARELRGTAVLFERGPLIVVFTVTARESTPDEELEVIEAAIEGIRFDG